MLSYDKTPASHYGSVRAPPLSSTSMSSPMSPRPSATPPHRHLFIVTGPAGCGKSTVAEFLAEHFDFPYIEGDLFHPPANIEKMGNGIPLNDGDRWDWLCDLREEAVKMLENGVSGAVLTCSALKNKYRDVIRAASYNDHNVHVHFIYLRASEELLLARVKARQGHYMKDSMVKSQFEALEEPRAKEHDVISIDVSGSMIEVQTLAAEAVSRVMASESV